MAPESFGFGGVAFFAHGCAHVGDAFGGGEAFVGVLLHIGGHGLEALRGVVDGLRVVEADDVFLIGLDESKAFHQTDAIQIFFKKRNMSGFGVEGVKIGDD